MDVQAYNIPLTGLGIYMGNDYTSVGGSWAGSIIIETTSTGPSSSSPTVKPSSSPTVKPSSPTVKPSSSPTVIPSSSPTVKPSSSPTVKPSSSRTVKPSSSPTVKPSSSPTVKPSLIVNLTTLGTISACNYIQIPFSETGSILQSITFSGVNQSKLRICFIIDYY